MASNLSDTLVSVIRTTVAIVVGSIAAFLAARLHFIVTPATKEAVTTVATGGAIALYYAGVRLLEAKWPKAGVLLGIAKVPQYSPPTVAQAVAAVEPAVVQAVQAVAAPAPVKQAVVDAVEAAADAAEGAR